ncbi:GerW family sporulation protein [Ruminococcus albus]|uniref:Sporulation protein YtfJ n=1 Tax=Ruminococcus albus (strain ATCC 27210 / DSM 20455 / JCM 14654 / NCDO 2250 / 7) TaxID=697329 RepID=E6UHX6_RUMA7|nr:spore germination protein GerW family protein [Ruminococcus albus]ADU23263.1 Sporulation protein YtfJ [Ruminococcus albus 7 = DSM 20455]
MNESTKIEALVNTAMSKVKELADGEAIVGKPIVTGDGTTIIPVSKVSVGFASGGSDLPTKSTKDTFGGGSGGGVTITPVAFIAIYKGEVKLLQITSNSPQGNAIVDMVPTVIDKITSFIDGKKGGKKAADEIADDYADFEE